MEPADQQTFVARDSRRDLLLIAALFASIIGLFAGIALSDPTETGVLLRVLAILGPWLAWALVAARRVQARLEADVTGLRYVKGGVYLRWAEIAELRLRRMGSYQFLEVRAVNPAVLEERWSKRRPWRRPSQGRFDISLVYVADLDEVAREIEARSGMTVQRG